MLFEMMNELNCTYEEAAEIMDELFNDDYQETVNRINHFWDDMFEMTGIEMPF